MGMGGGDISLPSHMMLVGLLHLVFHVHDATVWFMYARLSVSSYHSKYKEMYSVVIYSVIVCVCVSALISACVLVHYGVATAVPNAQMT